MKIKILYPIIAIILLLATLSGCGITKPSPQETTGTTQNGSTTENVEENTADDTQSSTSSTETTVVDDTYKYKEALQNTKIELLNIDAGIPFADMYDDGFFPADYDNKTTMITIGIEFADTQAYNAFKSIEFFGETASDPKDSSKSAYQFLEEAYNTKNNLYSVRIYTVQGTVDPSKVQMHITTDNKDVYEDRKFEDNGVPVGFKNAISKFSENNKFDTLPSDIIALNNRHYKAVSTGRTEYDYIDMKLHQNQTGYDLIVQYRISLLPLEDGYKRTLSTNDIKITNIPDNDTKYTVEVKNENVFGGTDPIHTSIYVTARKHLETLEMDSNGKINTDKCKLLLDEIDNAFKNICIEAKNGNETISLSLV